MILFPSGWRSRCTALDAFAKFMDTKRDLVLEKVGQKRHNIQKDHQERKTLEGGIEPSSERTQICHLTASAKWRYQKSNFKQNL